MSNNPFMPKSSAPMSMPMPIAGNQPNPAKVDDYEGDLTNVTDGFLIPEGTYRVKLMDISQDVSKGGNPMFVWTFEVNEGQYKGFQSKVFTVLTPAAMWKVAETVQALGIGQSGTVVKFKRADVLNKECGAIFETQEYQGQNRSQISKVISLKELSESRA